MNKVERINREYAAELAGSGQLGPAPDPELRYIAFGAGVQSSTVAMLAAEGVLEPMPDLAIFANTQYEPKRVYQWFEFVRDLITKRTNGRLEVVEVTAGSVRDDVLANAGGKHEGRNATVPAFVDVGQERPAPIGRSCTTNYKIEPMRRLIRERLGIKSFRGKPDNCVESWVGISTDEAYRAKPSGDRWEWVRWPLLELRMSRGDCLEWWKRRYNVEPPKSACVACPYHNDAEWAAMKSSDPESFADAVAFDAALRSGPGLRGLKGDVYLHRSVRPLDQVEFERDRGQMNLFMNECSGMCGV